LGVEKHGPLREPVGGQLHATAEAQDSEAREKRIDEASCIVERREAIDDHFELTACASI
jgi:hypothetical protein